MTSMLAGCDYHITIDGMMGNNFCVLLLETVCLADQQTPLITSHGVT